MNTFAYKAFPMERVVEMFGVSAPDSYLSADAGTDAILAALREGYRWVRTDGGDFAIFEVFELAEQAAVAMRDCSCGAKVGELHQSGCRAGP